MKLLDEAVLKELEGVTRYYRASLLDSRIWGSQSEDWAKDEYLIPLAIRAVKQLDLRGEVLREIGRWEGNLTAYLSYAEEDEPYYGVSMEEIILIFERMIEVHHERKEGADDGQRGT